MTILIDLEKCVGCAACIADCPVTCLEMDGDKVKVDADACIDCGACIQSCPVEALAL
jgi:NAD-dependent dihydropyrimidine dehydrogenase PreA subunit